MVSHFSYIRIKVRGITILGTLLFYELAGKPRDEHDGESEQA